MRFAAPQYIVAYLPAAGAPGPLDADSINPMSTTSGVFGSDALGVRLNIDFTDAGVLHGSAGIAFGDLTLCSLTVSALNGLTVRDVTGIADTLLGGGSSVVTITDLYPIVAELNVAFGGGGVSFWAPDHLVNGACP